MISITIAIIANSDTIYHADRRRSLGTSPSVRLKTVDRTAGGGRR